MNISIKKMQAAQAIVWVLTACYVIMSETGWLPTCSVSFPVYAEYWAQIYSVVSALAGSYIALRLFAFRRIKEKIGRQEEPKALRTYCRYAGLRIGLIAVVMWSNALMYYIHSFHPTTLYCFLISAVASCFCWPSKTSFRNLRTPKPEAK